MIIAAIGEELVRGAARFARWLWLYVALAALLTTVMMVAGGADRSVLGPLFLGNLLLSTLIAASFEVGSAFNLQTKRAEKLGVPARTLLRLTLFVACVLVGIECALLAIRTLAPSMIPMFPRTMVIIVALPVSLAMMGIAFLKTRAEKHRVHKAEVERQLAQIRLTALAARTEPHFLFNSLNSIASLIEEDPQAAERGLVELAGMFRYVLDGSAAVTVPLREELAFVRQYLSLEQLRFGDRLAVDIDIDPALECLAIPPLLLQALVENAVRHGIAARTEPGRVAIRIASEGDSLLLSVDDDGPGPNGSRHRGAQTSHADLRARLALVYPEGASFETGRSPLGGFRALMRVPRYLP